MAEDVVPEVDLRLLDEQKGLFETIVEQRHPVLLIQGYFDDQLAAFICGYRMDPDTGDAEIMPWALLLDDELQQRCTGPDKEPLISLEES